MHQKEEQAMHDREYPAIDAIERFLLVESSPPEKTPLIFVFGGNTLQLSCKAAELHHKGLGDCILVSGGKNPKLTKETEAQRQRRNLLKLGVTDDRILLEERATNTKENVIFSRKVIEKHFDPFPEKMTIVCHAFHGRRVLMTLRNFFPMHILYNFQFVYSGQHKRENWWKDAEQIEHVLSELRKICDYTLKGDLTLE